MIAFALHYFLEGLRWQMCFVYFITFSLVFFYNNRRFKKNRWLGKTLLIVCLLITLFTGVIAKMIPVFHLPNTTSNYSVGTQNFLLKGTKEDTRELKVKFWFPSSRTGNPDGIYTENPSESLDGLMGMPGFVFGHLKLVKTGTFKKAEVIENPNKLPLVLYSHGATSTNLDNTALLQQIASNGFIVVAIDYNFSFDAYGLSKAKASTLDFNTQKAFVTDLIEKVVPKQVEDILFTLREVGDKNFPLFDHIDFDNIALIGHSLGGTTAIDASLNLQGVKSIINIDGPINPRSMDELALPLLYISSYSPHLSRNILEKKGVPDVELYQKVKKWELENVQWLSDNDTSDFHWVRFKDAGHLDFTDVPFILPIMTTEGYDKYKGHRLKSTIAIDFLDFYLKDGKHFRRQKDDSVDWIK